MKILKKPKLNFSPWLDWKNRDGCRFRNLPGVYAMAITKRNLHGKKFNFSEVVYFGMTNNRGGLKARWRQFNRAIHGKRSHSGGTTIFRKLGNYKNWKDKLFVSACPIKCDVLKVSRTSKDLISMGWVAFLEYEALAKYKKLFDKEPKYNKK